MGLGPLTLGRWIGRGTRDHQDAHLIGRFHPGADRLERSHHIGVQGVQFVGAVNGHAGKESEVCLFAERVELDLHHIAFRGVHGLTEPSLLLDVIAPLQ